MPDWKQEIRNGLVNLNLEPKREASIIDELAADLEECYEKLSARGTSPAEAYRRTLAELNESELLVRELQRIEQQPAPEPIVLEPYGG